MTVTLSFTLANDSTMRVRVALPSGDRYSSDLSVDASMPYRSGIVKSTVTDVTEAGSRSDRRFRVKLSAPGGKVGASGWTRMVRLPFPS